MFQKEATWVLDQFKQIACKSKDTRQSVLDVGCSTTKYREEKQPYVGHLFRNISKLGFDVSTLDLDPETDATFVCDLTDSSLLAILCGQTFDVVTVTNVLEHLYRDGLAQALQNIFGLSNKFVIATIPLFCPWHFQPIDNGLRLHADQLADLFGDNYSVLTSGEWQEEHYREPYISDPEYPKPWVSGVVLEKK